MPATGPDFIALQVTDLDRAASFYEKHVGLTRAPTCPPGAVVFATKPIPFAVRSPLPGIDLLAAQPHPGVGVALWLHADDADELHDQLSRAGVTIVKAPSDGPFGRQFTFADPDGYTITVHDAS